ncbi:MAG: hypothetical protein KAJ19_04695 [Gammaproteobacteria bacterium]|nr:hypothetical protein [Gammaproteobacteria bacterium]
MNPDIKKYGPGLLAALALLVLVGMAYQDAPGNGFHFDDLLNIVNYPPVHLEEFSIAGLYKAGKNPALSSRPLPSVTFAFDWWRGGGSPAPFQWTNMFLHGITALLVMLFIHTLLKQTNIPARYALGFAWLVAAVWAVHPIQVQTVTYVVQRMAIMAVLFSLLSVWCYIKARLVVDKKYRWYLFSVIALVCGAISKEIAWITPALILIAEYGVLRHKKPLVNDTSDYLLLSLPLLVLAYVLIDIASGSGPISHIVAKGYMARDFSLSERLLSQPRVILFYLSQVGWPSPEHFSIEHDFSISTGILSPVSTLSALAVLLCWTVLGIYLLFRKQHRILGFALLWVPGTLVIESSVIPLEMVFEHRMYLPLVGLAILLALVLAAAYNYNIKLAGALSGLVILFMLYSLSVTMQRVPDWESDLTLYESALDNAPTSSRLWENYGYALLGEGDIGRGRAATEYSLLLSPDNAPALSNLGVVMARLNKHKDSIEYFKRALKLEKNPSYHWNIALSYEKLKQCEQAEKYWLRAYALERNPKEKLKIEKRLAREYKSPKGMCS